MATPRKLKPVVETHADTAMSPTETTSQYFAVTIHGDVAITQPGPKLDEKEEAFLVKKTLDDEVMKARNVHTILRKDVHVLHKAVL